MNTKDLTEIPPRVEPPPGTTGDLPIYFGPKLIGFGVQFRRGKGEYYVRINSGLRERSLGRFPLPSEGWRDAWTTFASLDPDGAVEYWGRLRGPDEPTLPWQ